MNRLIERRQLWIWILTAMIAPLATVMAGQPWLSVGVTAVVCTALCWTLHGQIRGDVRWAKWFCVLQWIWSTFGLSYILRYLPMAWPQAENPMLIGAVLLITALWAVTFGAEICARVGSTLAWIVGLLMVMVFVAALKDIQPKNLSPEFMVPNTEIFYILLIPCMAVLLPRHQRGGPAILVFSVAFIAFAVSFLTTGILSSNLTMSISNPFYEMSRTLTLSGAAHRFEALVCAGLTISWFLLLCLFLSVSGSMANEITSGRAQYGAATSAIAAVMICLCNLRINAITMTVGSVIFWGILPVLAQGVGERKKL